MNEVLLRNARNILATMRPDRRFRAKQMMKLHQHGLGECHIIDGVALLRWPATNKQGEGDGAWTAVLSGHIRTCACPSFEFDPDVPCKHLVLLARLTTYHAGQEEQQCKIEKEMQVCTG